MRQRAWLYGLIFWMVFTSIAVITVAAAEEPDRGARSEGRAGIRPAGGAEPPALFTDPQVPDGMVLSYRSKMDEKAPFVQVIYTAEKAAGVAGMAGMAGTTGMTGAAGQDGPVYLVRSEAGDGNVVIMRLRAADLRPLYVEKRNGRKQVVQINEYGPEEVRLTLPQKGVTRTFPNSPDLYDQESLFFVFLGFPFEETERRLSFQLFMGENGIHRVSLQVAAEEDIQVPAGTFAAYKLELVPEGLAGLIGSRFRSYFWYTRRAGRHGFLKYAFPAFGQISESTALPDWAQNRAQKGAEQISVSR